MINTLWTTVSFLGIVLLSSGHLIQRGELDFAAVDNDGDDMFDSDVNIEAKFRREDYDDDRKIVGGGRRGRQTTVVNNTNPGYAAVESGVGCGYLRMRPGQVVTVQSSNFQTGEYFNNEACVWKFFGHHCVLTAQCPCADIPQSGHCLQDYLKISDGFIYLQRFCGDIRPEGDYTSATNNLRIKFRSDHKETAAGFLCYVSCAPPGRATYVVPNNITCPTIEILGASTLRTSTVVGQTGSTTDPTFTGEPVIPGATPDPQGPGGK